MAGWEESLGIFGLGDESWCYLELGIGVEQRKGRFQRENNNVQFNKLNLMELMGILVDIDSRHLDKWICVLGE